MASLKHLLLAAATILFFIGGDSQADDLKIESLKLPPLLVNGQPARAHTQGMEIHSSKYYVTARRDDQLPKRALLARTDARATGWDVWDITPVDADGALSALDHPGGMQSDGKRLWIPLAESKRNGRSVVRAYPLAGMIPGQPLKPELEFSVADHIGAIAVDQGGKVIYGANWDTESLYAWDFEGRLHQALSGAEMERRGLGVVKGDKGRAGLAVQDWKVVGDRLFASGLFRGPGVSPELPQSRLMSFAGILDSGFKRRSNILPKQNGRELAHEAMAISDGWVYFLPEDLGASNQVFRVSLAALNRTAEPAEVRSRPNIVLILADDLGAHDLGCYGADLHETPQLDRLARESVRFTRAYAPSPVCTPTRASLLTGKNPARLQMTVWSEGSLSGPTNQMLLQANSRHDLAHTETTLARHLQQAGYLTAMVGKWHLGDANHYPETHGFDVNIGGTHWGAPTTFFFPYSGSGRFGSQFRYVPHLELGKPGEYLTDRLTDEALRVIDHAADAKKPFFLYLAHYAPHTPMEAKPGDVAHFESRLRPGLSHQNATYAAMVRSLDESVGRVLTRLRERGLETNTIFVFASDNGGYLGTDRSQTIPVTSNAPLRSGKGTLYQGGLRVPLIVRWPGVTPVGVECRESVLLTDLFPTLMAAAGLPIPADQPADSVDLSRLLRIPDSKLDRDALFFHYPHYYHAPPSSPASAVVAEPWKLIEFFEDEHVELYNLRDDPAEANDLAKQLPEKAAGLRARLNTWRASVGAALPRPNPDFKRSATN